MRHYPFRALGVARGCPSRFVVLPDFFADDILFDARKVPLDRVELPSENFLLHFTGKQDAIVMSVFENRDQDVRVTLAGNAKSVPSPDRRSISARRGARFGSPCSKGAGMWHAIDVTKADAEKVMPLDWKMPFMAQWRVDFTRRDGLTDSWDMLLPNKEGDGFIKPSWLTRRRRHQRGRQTKTGEVDRTPTRPAWIASDRARAGPRSLDDGARLRAVPMLVGRSGATDSCSRWITNG